MKSSSCISRPTSPQAHSTARASTDLIIFFFLFYFFFFIPFLFSFPFFPFYFPPSVLSASTAGPCPPNPSVPRTAQMIPILPSITGTLGRFKGKAPELQSCGQEFPNSRSMGRGFLHSFWTQPIGVKCCCSFPHSFQLFYRRVGFKSYFSQTCSLLFKVWL